MLKPVERQGSFYDAEYICEQLIPADCFYRKFRRRKRGRFYLLLYGNIKTPIITIAKPYLYTGREYDPETGLYFYRARQYDAKTGRSLQKDPMV